jgi:5-formyltetrahydrofolate cyclo-ligase
VTITVEKKDLRTSVFRKRRALNGVLCQQKSREIAGRLLASRAFSSARCVHCYLATPTEVQTGDIIRESLRKKKRVVVPAFLGDHTPGLCEMRGPLQTGPFGILQPSPCHPVKAEEVDLWIVPGVGFGRDGSRLGRGGGFYDRLLAQTHSTVIGLAFDFQVLDHVPTEPQDRFVDCVITELETVICKRPTDIQDGKAIYNDG